MEHENIDDLMMLESEEWGIKRRVYNLPCGHVVWPCKRSDYGAPEGEQEDTREQKKKVWSADEMRRIKVNRARNKAQRKRQERKNREILKETEYSTSEEIIYRFFRRNKAVQIHLMYFSLLSSLAIENKWRIGYGMYRKRMSADKVKKTRDNLKQWVQKNGKEVMGAVSVGWGKNGYIYIYTVCTSENELAVFDFNTKLARYLRNNKCTPIECRPFEKDPYGFLDGHYCQEIMRSTELTELQADELAHMIRSSFLLYGTYKTLCTNKAKDKMETIVCFVDDSDLGATKNEHHLLEQGIGYMEGWGFEEEPIFTVDDLEF